MPFAIITRDKLGTSLREEYRAAHYAYLEANLPRLIASGGLRDSLDEAFIGGLIVYDTESEEEARAFAASDPFTKAGLFESVEIIRWRAAFMNAARVLTKQ